MSTKKAIQLYNRDASMGQPRSTQKQNSGIKQNETVNLKDHPLFKYNPEKNGYDLLPLDLTSFSSECKKSGSKSAQKQNSAKKENKNNLKKDNIFFKFNPDTKEFDFQPLHKSLLTWDNKEVLEQPPKNSKIRKIDHCVRKELFKVPVHKPQSKKKTSIKGRRSAIQADSPLGYPFKSPRRPVLKFTRASPILEEGDSKLSGDAEFLELEQLCGLEVEMEQSPVSSVCEMMESTMQLDSAKKGNHKTHKNEKSLPPNVSEALLEIEEILEDDKLRYEKLQEQIRVFDEEHRNSLSRIQGIMQRLRGDGCKTEDNKENDNNNQRRSLRLKQKNGGTDSCSKGLASPVMLKAGDLRKKTLTKSLVDKYQKYQIQSPRIEKALSLYNSMRKDVSILSTPKINRNLLATTPGGVSSAKSLSIRVQKQCLLLQDTPVGK